MEVKPVPKFNDAMLLKLNASRPIICREFGSVSELIWFDINAEVPIRLTEDPRVNVVIRLPSKAECEILVTELGIVTAVMSL